MWPCGDVGLDQHPPRQAGMNLNAPDGAALHFVKALQQTDDLIAHDEVLEAEFRPRVLVRVQLHVSQRNRPRIEDRLQMPDLQIFDAAVVDGLAQAHKGLARRRKLRES
jgi:hypothetical protein